MLPSPFEIFQVFENPVSEGDAVYEYYKQMKNTEKFISMDEDAKINYFHKQFPDFARFFPITMKYIVLYGEYNSKALGMLCSKIQQCPYKSYDEYFKLQADYVKFLFMKIKKHYNQKELQFYWQNTYDTLKQYHDDFEKNYNLHKQQLEELENKSKAERLDALKKFISDLKK